MQHGPHHDGPLGRRRLLTLGALGLLGAGATSCASSSATPPTTSSAAAATPTSPAPAPTPAPGTPAVEDLAVGEDATVRVSLTTSWLKPGLDRDGIDDAAVQAQPRTASWLSHMDVAQHKWLRGKTDTQAALGSRVTVREVRGSWAQVSFLAQAAPNEHGLQTSWVPTAHLVRDTAFLATEDAGPFVRVTADAAALSADEARTSALATVPFGTRLPLLDRSGAAVRVAVPGSGPAWLAADAVAEGEPALGTADEVIATAKTFEGVPYLWAGMTPIGFDCSGFTYSVLRSHGILLPRDAGPQLNSSGLPKVPASDLSPGDLLFYSFAPGGERIRHVALYVGQGYGIHAPTVGREIVVETLETINVMGDYAGAVRPAYAQA
ncbi:C40 family peptidase [Micrococcus sp.]|uniref:C40 family peptidase n=1 Tax=Micrococcus sp. TaxID=1271 RepID=UPI0026DC5426|nr:C40 family peptidase [Micrococcus sp.]MDO4240303.1 NlpC/P60 family protein [Micrococcus sp.]